MRYVDLIASDAVEPVTLTQTKAFLRIDSSAEDAWFSMAITAARQQIEAMTGMLMVSRNFKAFMPRFPGDGAVWWDGVREGPESWINNYQAADIVIRRAPVTAISAVIAYGADLTTNVVPASVYNVSIEDARQPARIRLAFGQVWPSIILVTIDGVEVDFIAGFNTTSGGGYLLPMDLQLAIMVVVGEMYAKRGDGELMISLAMSSAWPTISRYIMPDLA